MQHSRVSRSVVSSLSLLVCGLTVLGASGLASAAECPSSSPDRTEERRALAKEWFARAEAAENAGNDIEAVRAYACSMRMVAHAFTAFNLGRVAERSGDVELALKSYRAYLTLKSDAPDKETVQAKIVDLEAKVKEVKENIVGAEPAATEPAAPPTEAKTEVAEESTPPNHARPLPIEPPPHVSEPVDRGSRNTTEWVIGGAVAAVGVAALTVGIIENIIARNDMNKCNNDADATPPRLASAKSSCDSAKPAAYTSYAMFGVAGAAIAAEVGIVLYHFLAHSSDNPGDSSLSLGWMPGGLSLSAHGRF